MRKQRRQRARRIIVPKPNGSPERSLGTSTAALAVSHGIMRTTIAPTNNPGTSKEPPTRTRWEEAPLGKNYGEKPPLVASRSTTEGVGLQKRLMLIIVKLK